jgi:uncharacterized RDD family membrane protein YckC
MQNNPYVQSDANQAALQPNTIIYAGFWRRFGASFIDALIISLPGLVVGGSFNSLGVSVGLPTLIGFFYFPIFESSVLKATPGKALLNMLVLTESGERVSFKSAFIRFATSYLSSLICYIGYLIQPFTSKRQTLHDMISETIVVDQKSPDINYFTAWKEQFKEVTNKL